jgi:hypothetical protein
MMTTTMMRDACQRVCYSCNDLMETKKKEDHLSRGECKGQKAALDMPQHAQHAPLVLTYRRRLTVSLSDSTMMFAGFKARKQTMVYEMSHVRHTQHRTK